jgi:hypothetical protein
MGLIPYVDTNFVFHYNDKTIALDRKDQEICIEDYHVYISHQTHLIQIDTPKKNSFYFVFESDEEGFKFVKYWEFLKSKWNYELKKLQEIRIKIFNSNLTLLLLYLSCAMVSWIIVGLGELVGISKIPQSLQIVISFTFLLFMTLPFIFAVK